MQLAGALRLGGADGVERRDDGLAAGGGAVGHQRVDCALEGVAVGAGRQQHIGLPVEGHKAHLELARHLLREPDGGVLRGAQAVGRHVVRCHGARHVNGQHDGALVAGHVGHRLRAGQRDGEPRERQHQQGAGQPLHPAAALRHGHRDEVKVGEWDCGATGAPALAPDPPRHTRGQRDEQQQHPWLHEAHDASLLRCPLPSERARSRIQSVPGSMRT